MPVLFFLVFSARASVACAAAWRAFVKAGETHGRLRKVPSSLTRRNEAYFTLTSSGYAVYVKLQPDGVGVSEQGVAEAFQGAPLASRHLFYSFKRVTQIVRGSEASCFDFRLSFLTFTRYIDTNSSGTFFERKARARPRGPARMLQYSICMCDFYMTYMYVTSAALFMTVTRTATLYIRS